MDRISTATKAVDLFGAGKHGFRDGDLANSILPTDFNAAWANNVQEELLAVIEGSGQAAAVGVLNQVTKAIKRFARANLKTLTAGASALTVDDAGMVLVDATGGNVTLTLPAANVVAGLGIGFTFYRIDSTGNTVTINRAGADAIDGATSFSLTSQFASRSIRGNGSNAWASTARTGETSSDDAGEVVLFARNTAPTGYLKANGAEVPRATYAGLFAAIGVTFGAGDGSTTFNVPDLRGEFIRGWDDGRGIDSGRVFGSAQAGAFASHTHGFANGGSAALTTNGGPLTLAGLAAGSAVGNATIANSGGTETRPRNVALLACIKY